MRVSMMRYLTILIAQGIFTGMVQAEVIDLTGVAGIQTTGTVMTFGTLEAKAYIIDTNNGALNTATTELLNGGGSSSASSLLPAQLGQYANGLGVTTTAQGGDNGTGSPEQTMDNQLGFEFIVFRLPSDFDLVSLTIASLSGGAGTGTGDGDITVWIGGSNFNDFSDFDNQTLGTILGSPDLTSLSGSNFQRLNLVTADSAALTEPTSGTCALCIYTDPAMSTGKWLIVASALTINGSQVIDRDDNILIASITSASTNVPEPATLALLGLGLLGLGFARRRKQ